MKFWNKNLFIFFLLLIGFFFIGLFYIDLNKKIDVSDSDSIGTVSYKFNTIQRKFFSSVVWRKTDSETKIKNKDTIRTFSESDAKIKLKDGTEIEIDQNSMIFLDTDNSSPNIRFQGGSFSINKKKSSSNDLTIDYQGQKLKLNEGQAKIESNENGLKVNIKEGKAILLDKNGQKEINQNETLETTKDGFKISSPSIILEFPIDSKKFLFFNDKMSMNFSWIEKTKLKSRKIFLSQYRNFFNSNQFTLNTNSYTTSLAPGIYYWKVEGTTDSGEKKSSEVFKFNLFKEVEFVTQTPPENSKYQNNQAVRFKWNEMQNVKDYTLEIAKDKDFSKDLKIYTTKTNTYSVSDLNDSVYYWRVITRSNIIGILDIISPTKKMLIGSAIKENELSNTEKENSTINKSNSKLSLNFPKLYQILKFAEEKKTIIFNWFLKEDSKFELAKDKNFSEILVSKDLKTNSYSYNFTKSGKYYWRIVYNDESKSSQFQILLSELEKLGSVKLLSPLNKQIDISLSKVILFQWKPQERVSSYIFKIKTKSGRVVISKTLNSTEFKLNDFSKLSEGKFIWEVIGIQPNIKNQKISVSSFEINLTSDPLKKLKPEEIKVISPETIYRE